MLIRDYTCGLCGEEFGSNCRPGDIECTECEARLCPCCGAWFTEAGDTSETVSDTATRLPEAAIAAAAGAIDQEYYENQGRHIERWARDIAILALEAAWPFMPALAEREGAEP